MFNSKEIKEANDHIKELEKTIELKNNELRVCRKAIYDWKSTALKMRTRVFSHGATPAEKMLLDAIYDNLENHGVIAIDAEIEQLAKMAKIERARACINRAWNNTESVQGDAVREPLHEATIFFVDEAEQGKKPD